MSTIGWIGFGIFAGIFIMLLNRCWRCRWQYNQWVSPFFFNHKGYQCCQTACSYKTKNIFFQNSNFNCVQNILPFADKWHPSFAKNAVDLYDQKSRQSKLWKLFCLEAVEHVLVSLVNWLICNSVIFFAGSGGIHTKEGDSNDVVRQIVFKNWHNDSNFNLYWFNCLSKGKFELLSFLLNLKDMRKIYSKLLSKIFINLQTHICKSRWKND